VNADEISAELTALESDGTLLEPERLNEREQAVHLLAFLNDALDGSAEADATQADLRARAAALSARFEAATALLVAYLGGALRAGRIRGASLRALLDRYTTYRPATPGFLHLNYEPVDVLIGGAFGLDRPVEETVPRTRDMVHLEFSPTSIVLEMVDRLDLGPNDLFVDLGAGLGQVAMLVHLLTGVRACGIDIEPNYVAAATRSARQFGLRAVRFAVSDARQADYTAATACYLFTPFHGQILRDVLARLRDQAPLQRLRICTYGPCTLEVARSGWLRSADGHLPHTSRLGLFVPR